MQGIGITQWQDNETNFPLINPGNLSGLFCDASLIVYDNFIPVLTSVSLTDDNIIFSVLFDDGIHAFSCPTIQSVQGACFRLRTPARTYGSVVFGRLIDDVIAGIYGNSINTSIKFESIVVRSITSNNGVFSINGLQGSVNITLDSNIFADGSTLNAISIPSNLTFVTTSSSDFYVNTSLFNMIELNPSINMNNNLLILDKPYAGIANSGTKFIGASGDTTSTLYDLNSLPGSPIVSGIPHVINGLFFYSSTQLFGVSSNLLLTFGDYPYTSSPTTSTIDITPQSMTVINSTFIACTSGDIDFATGRHFSSKFYSLTSGGGGYVSTLLGVMTDIAGDNHLPNLISITSHDGYIYGIAFDTNTGLILYQINPASLVAIAVTTYSTDASTGTALSLFVGGNEIITNSISPLKTINGVGADIYNNVSLAGSNTINIAVDTNTLTFSLPVTDQNLNVNRSSYYE